MSYLLDTNTVIGLMRYDRTLVRNANQHTPKEVSTSSIVIYELYYGAFKSARLAGNLRTLADIGLDVVDFGPGEARAAGEIRHQLETGGNPLGRYDLLIAGQALARDLTLVTRNRREFSRVGGLRVENWQD